MNYEYRYRSLEVATSGFTRHSIPTHSTLVVEQFLGSDQIYLFNSILPI
ncbi:hypothetical protein BDD14_4876 [Edaphobacter modestus]|uniref:Uncharacterized protein n=1 Tax=Edaphobacter modestus TaxID=388466 RepID=A0A4Q7Z170_9BACT|nr:hypothetical protein BDD14_4876 [Edaphobacter modestus]